jgi:hypothetical protein
MLRLGVESVKKGSEARPPKSRSRGKRHVLETCRSHAQLSFRRLQEGNSDEAFRRSADLGGYGIARISVAKRACSLDRRSRRKQGRDYIRWRELTVTRKVLAQMTTRHPPRSKTIWGRPHSNVPALRLESIELRDLLSRELDEANVVLDEWDFARTRDKQSGTSKAT